MNKIKFFQIELERYNIIFTLNFNHVIPNVTLMCQITVNFLYISVTIKNKKNI